MSILDVLSPDSASPPLWLSVPPEFVRIDPDEPLEARIQRMLADTSELPGMDAQQQINLVYSQEALRRDLDKAGAIYAAHCVAHSEHGSRLVTALFTVVLRDIPNLAGRSMAEIARGLREPGDPSEVILWDYPAGQAIVHGQHAMASWRGTTKAVRSAQVMFKMPNEEQLAILGLSTSDLEDWQDFAQIIHNIAQTVSFTRPSTKEPNIGDALNGGL